MSDDGILRRMPASVRGGNGIKVDPAGGSFLVSADLETLTVTPTGSVAPMNLRDVLATLIAHDAAQRYITVADDGFFDIPGSGNAVAIDDGNF